MRFRPLIKQGLSSERSTNTNGKFFIECIQLSLLIVPWFQTTMMLTFSNDKWSTKMIAICDGFYSRKNFIGGYSKCCGNVAHSTCDGSKTTNQFCRWSVGYLIICAWWMYSQLKDFVHKKNAYTDLFDTHLTITNSFGNVVMWHTSFRKSLNDLLQYTTKIHRVYETTYCPFSCEIAISL